MRLRIIGVLTCFMIVISIPAIAETITNDSPRPILTVGLNFRSRILNQNNYINLIEAEYTTMIGFISNYSKDGYNVTFHADFLFIYFFSPWTLGYAGFAIDKEIFFNTYTYKYWVFKTKPGPSGISFYLADYGAEVEIHD